MTTPGYNLLRVQHQEVTSSLRSVLVIDDPRCQSHHFVIGNPYDLEPETLQGSWQLQDMPHHMRGCGVPGEISDTISPCRHGRTPYLTARRISNWNDEPKYASRCPVHFRSHRGKYPPRPTFTPRLPLWNRVDVFEDGIVCCRCRVYSVLMTCFWSH